MDKDTLELINHLRSNVPSNVTRGLAVKAFAFLFADAIYQMDKEKSTTFDAAEKLFETIYEGMQKGKLGFS